MIRDLAHGYRLFTRENSNTLVSSSLGQPRREGNIVGVYIDRCIIHNLVGQPLLITGCYRSYKLCHHSICKCRNFTYINGTTYMDILIIFKHQVVSGFVLKREMTISLSHSLPDYKHSSSYLS